MGLKELAFKELAFKELAFKELASKELDVFGYFDPLGLGVPDCLLLGVLGVLGVLVAGHTFRGSAEQFLGAHRCSCFVHDFDMCFMVFHCVFIVFHSFFMVFSKN